MAERAGPGPFLALDTATAAGGVAVGHGRTVLARVALDEPSRHAENLLPAIDEALECAGIDGAGLAGVVVGAGPGSFTGVRIAAATAKGLVHAWRVPLHAWSSLAMTAAGAGEPGARVVALYDARRSEVFAASYRVAESGLETLAAPFAAGIEAVLDRLSPEGAVFAGDGATLHEARIRARGGVVVPSGDVPSSLLWLAATRPDTGLVRQPSSWEPGYVRASGAERIHGP